MSRWSCVSHPDNLCYICAKYTPCNQSNEKLSVPNAHAVGMKETHESMEEHTVCQYNVLHASLVDPLKV